MNNASVEVDINLAKKYNERAFMYGINRISFGIQDFDLKVQKAINRVHTPELMENLLTPTFL